MRSPVALCPLRSWTGNHIVHPRKQLPVAAFVGIRPSQQPQRAGESEKASVRGDHLRSVAELRVRASTQAATAKRSRGFSWNFFTWCGVLGILAACWRSWSSGSVLSAVVGLMRLRSLSRRGSVRAKRGKLARFAVRGAILAVALSVLTDLAWALLLAVLWKPRVALAMLTSAALGAVKKLAKFLALILLS
ncbi:unnamed protein product [Symbiodinium natans]|uniref:Uncharacterized protein n=1 Tax=Symbiodinium natans TaxID=878477 RepID=A0A812I155_9DINO|nr:unnamed protein product [Symbiodinium natans]